MFGLVVLLIIFAYLAISGGAIWVAVIWARKRGRRGWAWGSVAALVMYNLVFWDLIPMLIVHRYYCATESGFWVYKTPEEWTKENRDALSTLEKYEKTKIFTINNRQIYRFNSKFQDEIEQMNFFHTMGKIERAVRDIQNDEIVVKQTYFFLGWGSASAVSGGIGGLEGIRRAFVYSFLPMGLQRCDSHGGEAKQFSDISKLFKAIGGPK